MTANKMPVMPEAVAGVMVNAEGRPVLLDKGDNYRDEIVSRRGLQPLYTADQMRAMCLAGIAAARGELPVRLHGENEWVAGHNACLATTIANLTALEQEAKK